jgi:hypothetical protein
MSCVQSVSGQPNVDEVTLREAASHLTDVASDLSSIEPQRRQLSDAINRTNSAVGQITLRQLVDNMQRNEAQLAKLSQPTTRKILCEVS